MAQFNPDVQQVGEQNYLGWSKSIQTPEANKSKALMLSGAGEVVESGAKAADLLMESHVTRQAYEQGSALRDQEIGLLENTLGIVRTQQQSDPKSPGYAPSDNILSTNTDARPVPDSLKGLPRLAQTMQAAKGSGKFSETEYKGRVDTLAKDLRSQYPGYRHYIDTALQRATGVDAANAYVSGLLGDLNSFVGKKDAEKEKAIGFLTRESNFGIIPNADKHRRDIEAGVPGAIDKMYADAYPVLAVQAKYKSDKEMNESKNVADKRTSEQAGTAFGQYSAGIAVNSLYSIVTDGESHDNVMDLISKVASGKVQPTDEMWNSLLTKVQADSQRVALQLRKDLHTPDPKTGRIPYIDMGDAESNRVMENALAAHKNVIEAISSKDAGLVYSKARENKALVDGTTNSIYGMKHGEALRLIKVADEIDPDLGKSVRERARANNLLPTEADMLEAVFKKTVATNNGPSAKVYPAVQALSEAQKGGVSSARFNKTLFDTADRLMDPNTPLEEKVAISKFFFDPANTGMIGHIKEDKGKFDIARGMGDERMAKSMHDLGKVVPEQWENYVNWHKSTFKNDLSPEIKNLENMTLSPNLSMAWHPDQHMWTVDRKVTPGQLPATADAQYRQAQQTVMRLNTGIRNLVNISKQDKGNTDVDSFVLTTLMEGGYNPLVGGGARGIPQAMVWQIIRAHAAELMKQKQQQEPFERPK